MKDLKNESALAPQQKQLLESLRAERQRLETKVIEAIAERDAFLQTVGGLLGTEKTKHSRGPMSAEHKQKLSDAQKRRRANEQTAHTDTATTATTATTSKPGDAGKPGTAKK